MRLALAIFLQFVRYLHVGADVYNFDPQFICNRSRWWHSVNYMIERALLLLNHSPLLYSICYHTRSELLFLFFAPSRGPRGHVQFILGAALEESFSYLLDGSLYLSALDSLLSLPCKLGSSVSHAGGRSRNDLMWSSSIMSEFIHNNAGLSSATTARFPTRRQGSRTIYNMRPGSWNI